MKTPYLVVTPARDESMFIGDLADSLLEQTVRPDLWVVVDDGSTDGTADVVKDRTGGSLAVRLIERRGTGERRQGYGGIIAAQFGLSTIERLDDYEYVAVIDADVVLPRDYFERLFQEFDDDRRLGIAGGHCYVRTKKGVKLDPVPDDHVHGATKIYRRECLRKVMPLDEVWGWDTVDEIRAQMAGWTTRSFLEPGFIHQRPMMSVSARGIARGKMKLGRICHFLGYRPDYLLFRALRHLGRSPYLLGGAAMAWGYFSALALRMPTIEDEGFKKYLRDQQEARLRSLLSGSQDVTEAMQR